MLERGTAAIGSISPERAFLVLGVVCGLLFVFVTPPFQAPDEPQHFYRAFHLSELGLFDVTLQEEGSPRPGSTYSGALLPSSLAAIVSSSDLLATRFQPAAKLIPSRVLAAARIPLETSQREYLPVAGYPPAGYLSQAVGIAIGRAVGLSPLLLLYCGRLGALATWIALVFISIRRAPLLKWPLFLLALMPMTLYMAASNSIDGFVIGATFFAVATLLQWIFDEGKLSITKMDLVQLTLVGTGIVLSKAIYLSVMLLFLLVPARKFKNRRTCVIGFVLVIFASVVVFWGWNWLKTLEAVPGPAIRFAGHAVDVMAFPDVSPVRQTQLLMSEPAAFIGITIKSVRSDGLVWLHSFVGQLGWLDTVLPLWLPYVYIGALIAASSSSNDLRVTGMGRFISAAIFAVTTLVLLLVVYISTNPVGTEGIRHIQGRYFIPLAPLALLAMSRNGVTRWKWTPAMLIVFSVASTGLAARCVLSRFYFGPGFIYRIEKARLSLEEGSLTVEGWAVGRNGGDISGGIELGVNGHYAPARFGIDRPDVAQELGDPSLRLSGFEGSVPLSGMSFAGERGIDLRITNGNGVAYFVPNPRIVVSAPSGKSGQ